MPLVLAGATSGSTTIQATDATTQTITLPANSGTVLTTASSGRVIPAAAMPAGSVIQVVQATYGTSTLTSSSTLTATGLSASITPSSSSNKILVCVNMQGTGKSTNNTALWLAIYRNGSNVFNISDNIAYTNSTVVSQPGTSSSMYLDSPATTSSTTYAIYFASSGNNAYVIVNNYFTSQSYSNSTLTLMEIAQ